MLKKNNKKTWHTDKYGKMTKMLIYKTKNRSNQLVELSKYSYTYREQPLCLFKRNDRLTRMLSTRAQALLSGKGISDN